MKEARKCDRWHGRVFVDLEEEERMRKDGWGVRRVMRIMRGRDKARKNMELW